MNQLKIDDSTPVYINCQICGTECDERDRICDGCWYGMRMCPEEWKAGLKARGIEVEKGMGCQPTELGFVCGDPYKAKAV